MTPIDPPIVPLAPGWRRVVYAKDQPEYIPLPTMRATDGRVVSTWEPTAEELETLLDAILAYKNRRSEAKPRISLMLHTFNTPLQPVRLVVGDFPEPCEEPCPMDRKS